MRRRSDTFFLTHRLLATKKGDLPPCNNEPAPLDLGITEVNTIADRDPRQPEIVDQLRLHGTGKQSDRLQFQNDLVGHDKIGNVPPANSPL